LFPCFTSICLTTTPVEQVFVDLSSVHSFIHSINPSLALSTPSRRSFCFWEAHSLAWLNPRQSSESNVNIRLVCIGVSEALEEEIAYSQRFWVISPNVGFKAICGRRFCAVYAGGAIAITGELRVSVFL
jgi:hypothetical protein